MRSRRSALACRFSVIVLAASLATAALEAQNPSVTAPENLGSASESEPQAGPSHNAAAQSPAEASGPAGDNLLKPTQPEAAAVAPWANRGRWTLGFQLGFSVEHAFPRNISHVNLLIAQPQLGLILWDSQQPRRLVERLEVINEGILGNAVHPGGRVTGETLLFRFDGKPRRTFVPFLDAGAGVLNTTLAVRAPELDGHVQFTPQAGLGVQYFFNPQRALVLEYRYMHMSNADLAPPNLGFNSSVITVGFRWLRRPARPAALAASSHPSHNPMRVLFGSNY